MPITVNKEELGIAHTIDKKVLNYLEIFFLFALGIYFALYVYEIFCLQRGCRVSIYSNILVSSWVKIFLVAIPTISITRIIYSFRKDYFNNKYNYLFYLANFTIVMSYFNFAIFLEGFIEFNKINISNSFFPFYFMLVGILISSLLLLSEKNNWDRLPFFAQIRLSMMLLHLVLLVISPEIGLISSFLFFSITLISRPNTVKDEDFES